MRSERRIRRDRGGGIWRDRTDEMPLWELTHLSLSYKNIIEIDNLLGMDKLQRLQLDNNIICKI